MTRPCIINRISNVAAELPDAQWLLRLPNHIDTIIVHRVSVRDMAIALDQTPGLIDIATLARLSKALPDLGHKLAYSFLILSNGTIEQGLPLTYISPHARSVWNRRAIGVAVEGDFRYNPPTLGQTDSLRWLLLRLRAAYCPSGTAGYGSKLSERVTLPCILGHGEAPNSHDGSKAPSRHNACPGRYLYMDALRAYCASDPIRRARDELNEVGIKFDA